MSEANKTYRIKANVGREYTENFIALDTNLIQDYDTLDILSIQIKSADTYRLHNSNYGVIVGRVLANNGFGIPNAKISVFIKSDSEDGELVKQLYPFSTTFAKDNDGVRYNLLPDEKVNDCHQVVGTFPNKRYMLDNDVVLEVFDKYYKYTTRTNNAGDYLIMGVPVGNQTLHMDLDLSDCGILSQRPRDFVYKGYTMEQFENPSLFKNGTNYPELSQIFSQDKVVNVLPFWGNESLGESIGITRADIDVAFKFETTCIFIGSVVSDNASNGITKKCMATENMGNMEELTTGEGTIEMIRKTPTGAIESFAVRGNQLINGNGVWCYQIPMNLDYMMTDEYGNMVPTNDPEKGIPTRASVRFRISMQDNEENLDFFYRCKVLVPHNPQYTIDNQKESYDYEFGSKTQEESFRDLFWDNVYTVKSYIPRFQKKKVLGWKEKKFTGIKNCNFYGSNNPIPYNNIRIKLPFMFSVMCVLVKCLMAIVMIFNAVLYHIGLIAAYMGNIEILGWRPFQRMYELSEGVSLNVLSEGLCPDLENWFFAPIAVKKIKTHKDYDVLEQTMAKVAGDNGFYDSKSVDYNNKESEDEVVCITTKRDYLISCVEMNLAMEYRVINFDFYNDWINGMIYVPRFMRYVKPKKTAGKKGGQMVRMKIKGCMDDTSIFAKSRRYTQQCSIGYGEKEINEYTIYTKAVNPLENLTGVKRIDNDTIKKANNLHKKRGFSQFTIFEGRGGICHEHQTSRKQNVYYMKPCEWQNDVKVLLYATDIVLLGSLKSCDENGLPQAFKYLSSTSYIMPTNLALTNMETSGPLYANGDNTVCAGTSKQNMTHNTEDDKGVHPIDPNEGIVAELNAYAGSNDANMDTQYEENELSDAIALTEAAGIAWNYTGPGQGTESIEKMFNPGGHFLGLSCINSQTNLKSCINLSRICEVGTTMSQRKEDIIDVTGDGKVDYIYTAPSGFISGNDINGEDFRTMFSTMNQRRLKATKVNNETGYYYYDLEYVRPLNFNGAFENVVNNAKDQYNGKVSITVANDEELKKFGISKGLGYDFDEKEDMRTQTRTIEAASLDYYRFRFGLSYEDIKTSNKNKVRHKHKFLYSEDGQKFMPQYENSYYFYFGLKAGATAIDEFNKQFFAVCDTSVVGKNNPTLTTTIEDIKLKDQTGDVSIVLDNVEMPLMNVTYMRQIENGDWETYDITSAWSQYYVINLNDIPFGSYRAEVVDFNGTRINGNFSVGLDIFKYSTKTYDFNISNAMVYSGLSNNDRIKHHIVTGGYVQIGDVDISDSYVSDISSALTFIITHGVISANTESAATIYRVENNSDNPPRVDVCVKSAYTNYNLYLHYDVINESGETETLDLNKALFLETFQVKDGRKLSLAIGWKDRSFYTTITPNGKSQTTTPIESAWTEDDKEYYEYIKEEDEVELNFGQSSSTIKWWENDINNDINSQNSTIVNNWLKRLSINKNTDSFTTFSNNVFAINGTKIVWGVPQNMDGKISGGTVFNAQSSPSEYAGYSLDDEVSYYETDDNGHYSAIAVNDDNLVSGNFFAYKSGGTIYFGNSLICGYQPSSGTGYVFKSLPDGNLSYHIFSNLENLYGYGNNDSGCGVYYASFEYPVIEKPFEVNAKFYIWNNVEVYMPENVDNIAEVRYKELAGRTELNIMNGNKYNNNYGLLDSTGNIVSGINISNITIDNFKSITSDSSKTSYDIVGMDVHVKNNDSEGNTSIDIIPAYKTFGDTTYATGVESIKNAVCEISEGYPGGSDVYSSLVTKYSYKYDYTDYFPHYVKYEYYKGRGLEINAYNKDGVMTKGNGTICKKLSNNLLITPNNNDKYVYVNSGSKTVPCYHILCIYKEFSGSTSPVDGLCFLNITYLNEKSLQATFDYKDSSGNTKTLDYYYTGSIMRNNFNIEKILELLKTNGYGYQDYITPIVKNCLNNKVSNWDTCIEKDNTYYLDWLDTTSSKSATTISSNEFYYVENYDDLYKIYPILLKDNIEKDGITLNTYYFGALNTGGTLTIELKYKTYKPDDSADLDILEAKTKEDAYNKIQYMYNGKSAKLSSLQEDNKLSNNLFSLYVSETKCSELSDGVNDLFDITYNLQLKVFGATTDYEKDNYFKDSIYFYISEKNKGVRFDVERLIAGDYMPILYEDAIHKKKLLSFVDALNNYSEGETVHNMLQSGLDIIIASGGCSADTQVLVMKSSGVIFYSKTLKYKKFGEKISCKIIKGDGYDGFLNGIPTTKTINKDNHILKYFHVQHALSKIPKGELVVLSIKHTRGYKFNGDKNMPDDTKFLILYNETNWDVFIDGVEGENKTVAIPWANGEYEFDIEIRDENYNTYDLSDSVISWGYKWNDSSVSAEKGDAENNKITIKVSSQSAFYKTIYNVSGNVMNFGNQLLLTPSGVTKNIISKNTLYINYNSATIAYIDVIMVPNFIIKINGDELSPYNTYSIEYSNGKESLIKRNKINNIIPIYDNSGKAKVKFLVNKVGDQPLGVSSVKKLSLSDFDVLGDNVNTRTNEGIQLGASLCTLGHTCSNIDTSNPEQPGGTCSLAAHGGGCNDVSICSNVDTCVRHCPGDRGGVEDNTDYAALYENANFGDVGLYYLTDDKINADYNSIYDYIDYINAYDYERDFVSMVLIKDGKTSLDLNIGSNGDDVTENNYYDYIKIYEEEDEYGIVFENPIMIKKQYFNSAATVTIIKERIDYTSGEVRYKDFYIAQETYDSSGNTTGETMLDKYSYDTEITISSCTNGGSKIAFYIREVLDDMINYRFDLYAVKEEDYTEKVKSEFSSYDIKKKEEISLWHMSLTPNIDNDEKYNTLLGVTYFHTLYRPKGKKVRLIYETHKK